jgi:hypothetical protein
MGGEHILRDLCNSFYATLRLSSPIRDCSDARAAANIVNSGLGEPEVADALQVLRKLVGLSNMIDNPELRLS